ncbi:MAG: hypothetical protein HZA77_05765 [Candidatus Schekmanbacteria bacterium]|nr:hypothetical protein [Candidatus Schekmanbacteria bacterium]
MEKRKIAGVICFSILMMFSTGCSTTSSLIKDKEAALEAKKKAYTNNSQVNTSFTLTMGEREFILGEREEKKVHLDEATVHYKKAKDFYDEAFVSSYLFQRNWTLENYQRIIQIKDMRLKINRLLRGAYKKILMQSLDNKVSDDLKSNYEAVKDVEEKISPVIVESDALLTKAIELSNQYDMFQTKYISLDAMKKLNDAATVVKEVIDKIFPGNSFDTGDI